MGFYHVENSFFLAGGTLDYLKYCFLFRKVRPDGEVTKLREMPTGKAFFAMTLWKQENALFTLGGMNESLLN